MTLESTYESTMTRSDDFDVEREIVAALEALSEEEDEDLEAPGNCEDEFEEPEDDVSLNGSFPQLHEFQ